MLIQCSHCSSRVKKSLLARHILKFHKGLCPPTHQKESSKEERRILSKEEAMRKILGELKFESFSTPQVFENYVFATRHRETGPPLRLFIMIQEKESIMAQEYAESRISMVFDVSKFRQRLRSMMRWVFNPKLKPVGELRTNVLTAFGWHAYLNEDIRQDSLLAAVNELGGTHVSKVLLWLKSSWPTNPIMPEEYSLNASQDYSWFCSSVVENTVYFRLKRKLLTTLQTECRRLAKEGKIEFSEHTGSIERFYMITY